MLEFGAGLPAAPFDPTAAPLAFRETRGYARWLGPTLFAAVPETGHNAFLSICNLHCEKFNRDLEDIPESRRQPTLSGMAGGERASRPRRMRAPLRTPPKKNRFMPLYPWKTSFRPSLIGPDRLFRRCPSGRG
jgi:hypothetical protein